MTSFQKTFQLGGSFIYGRANDIYGITKLLSSEEGTDINSAVISVVADRGTGRTTMLHLLHNELCNDFDITKYICMPKNFDEKGIMRLIAESLTGSSCDITDLEVLKETVKEELIDQRLLLFLDDFENKSQKHWDLLLTLLNICKKKSAIVVTATREVVAEVKGPIQFYFMNNLSDEWCLMIFKQGAFSGQNPDADAELADIGKCLVDKCGNVTLCIKVLSGVLRHSIDVDSWRAVLDDNFWEMDDVNGGILPALRVCYEYLPFHLKQCFKHCSLFPKEYIFSKKHLVRMWLSEGFIEPDEDRELEEIGLEHFDQLLSRSFLQASLNPDMKEDRFVMPGLIHDLARQFSRNECFQFEGCGERAPENACHLALVPHEFQSVLLSHLIMRPLNLQTILVVSRSAFQHESVSSSILELAELEDLFVKFCRLLTLDLSNADVEELPESLGSLTNLRYLGLSSTNIKRIPLEISNLMCLQTLEAKNCHYLEELPRTIEVLTNLHYLDVTKEAGYVVMPRGIGNLSNLRSLATFNIGMDPLLHCGIEELKDMKHLRGCLEISGLVNVRSGIDAKKADMRSKEHIETLCFQWSDGMSSLEGEKGSKIAEEVLESLHPTEKINEIIIRDYPGNSFPSWIENDTFSRLVSIIFDNCYNCEKLPALGALPLLRFLSIQKMYCVKIMSLCGSLYIPEDSIRYPSLEQLTIWEMYDLAEWIEIGNGHFPVLHSLCINRCPFLRNVPKFPTLIELAVSSCAQFLEAMDLPSLHSLKIEGLQKTRSFILPKNLGALNKLEISHCPELLSIEGLSLLNSLETIVIIRCPQLDSLDILDERLFAYEDRGNASVWLRKNKISSSDNMDVSGSGLYDEQQEHPNSLKERKDRADLSSLSVILAEGTKKIHKKIKEFQSPVCKQDRELIETDQEKLAETVPSSVANPMPGINTPPLSAGKSAMMESGVSSSMDPTERTIKKRESKREKERERGRKEEKEEDRISLFQHPGHRKPPENIIMKKNTSHRSMSSGSWTDNSRTHTTRSSEFSNVSTSSVNTCQSLDSSYGPARSMSDVILRCFGFESDDRGNTKEMKKLLQKKLLLEVISGNVRFTWDEILRATKCFSKNMVIGEGGCSVVYKGKLENGKEVAVKRAKKDIDDRKFSQESFQIEINTLQQICHYNLVGFYGYFLFEDEKIIVVEYLPNGNLRQHLDCKDGKVLEFANRLDIIIDIAHAINYLHTYCETPLIHRDIKASNILLTSTLRAKVGDFGLARLASTDPNNTSVQTVAKGTPGYIDPEYFRTNQLTTMSDVYSFGVLLIETVTAKRPVERTISSTTVKWALAEFAEGKEIGTIDPNLTANDVIAAAVKQIYELASRCLHIDRRKRPDMDTCSRVLWNIRKRYNDMIRESNGT